MTTHSDIIHPQSPFIPFVFRRAGGWHLRGWHCTFDFFRGAWVGLGSGSHCRDLPDPCDNCCDLGCGLYPAASCDIDPWGDCSCQWAVY